MTWDTIKASGSGDLEFRVMIEGLPYEFCSHVDMEQSLVDGRERVGGLNRDTIIIDDEVDPGRATLSAQGMNIEIMEDIVSLRVTKAFARSPSAETFLNADAIKTASFLTVLDETGFVANSVVHVGTEAIFVGTIGNKLLGNCIRGWWDTIAQGHFTTEDFLRPPQKVYQTNPPSVEGRRAQVFAYGGGDDLLGSGTLIWRGIVLTDAKLQDDGTTWSLLIGAVTEVLKQDLGADLEEPFSMRGIFYPVSAPLTLQVSSINTVAPYTKAIAGFWESQEEFVVSMQAELTTAIASDATFAGVTARVSGNSDEWWVDAAWNATALTNFVSFVFTSRIALGVKGNAYAVGPGARAVASPNESIQSAVGFNVANLTAGRSYRFGGGLGEPRGCLGNPRLAAEWTGINQYYPFEQPRQTSGTTPTTIYLDREFTPEAETMFHISFDDDLEPKTIEALRLQGATDEGHVLVYGVNGLRVWGPGNLPEVKPKRSYARGGLKGFRDAIVDRSPDIASKGSMPLITDSDLGAWTEVPIAERGFSFLSDRRYVAFDSIKMDEFLAEELKARAMYPAVSATTGKIVLKRLRMPSVTDNVKASITEDFQSEGGRATWERNALGSINTAVVRTGYDADEDEYLGRTYVVRDIEAYASKKAPRTLEVAMRSEYATHRNQKLEHLGYREFADMLLPVLGVFGRSYAVVTVDCDLRLADLEIGDVVDVTSNHFPNEADGTRGATLRGFIIGRQLELAQGKCQFKIMAFTTSEVFGYAPTLTVATQTNVSGNTWDITYSESDPYGVASFFQNGQTAEDHFAVNDLVRLVEWDVASPTTINGSVSTFTPGSNAMRLVLTSAWTPGSSDWVIEPREASAALQLAQERYMFVAAEAIASVGFNSEPRLRLFAP